MNNMNGLNVPGMEFERAGGVSRAEELDLSSMLGGKATQLTADMLLGGPLDIVVTGLRAGDSDEQPLQVSYEGDEGRPYRPCLSMRRLLVSLWGPRASDWVGKRMRLFRDEGVSYGGQRVAGVRVSDVSGIEGPQVVMLGTGRGKKLAWRVGVLEESSVVASASVGAVALEKLREGGAAAARGGMDALKMYWDSLGAGERRELKGDLEGKWKVVASAVDAEAGERAGGEGWSSGGVEPERFTAAIAGQGEGNGKGGAQ